MQRSAWWKVLGGLVVLNLVLGAFLAGFVAADGLNIDFPESEQREVEQVTSTETPGYDRESIESKPIQASENSWSDWNTTGHRPFSILRQLDGADAANPQLVAGPNGTRYYLFVSDLNVRETDLFVTTDFRDWELVKDDVNVSATDITQGPNGTYYAYNNDYVAVSDDLRNWERVGEPLSNATADDPGVLYDPTTGVFHLYYSDSNLSRGDCCSNYDIYHATSTDGVNFTPNSSNPILRTEFKTGDFEVVRVDGVYHLFADNDTTHQVYNVKHWVSKSPTGFERSEDVVEPQGWCDRGIGDPSITLLAGGDQWVMAYECWGESNAKGIGFANSSGPFKADFEVEFRNGNWRSQELYITNRSGTN